MASKQTINDILPSEILSTIFEHVLVLAEEALRDVKDAEDMANQLRLALSAVEDARNILSQVCSLWRSTAFNTPLLWRHVQIDDKTPAPKLQAFLPRSGGLTIDVTIDFSANCPPAHAMALVILVLNHVQRWRVFACRSARYLLMRDLLLLLDGVEAPNLTALSLTDNGDDDEEVEHESASSTAYPLFKGPSSVPKLQTLDFWAVPLRWESCPFGNLLNLELSRLPEAGRPTATTFLNLLRSSPNLESLVIRDGAVVPSSLAAAFDGTFAAPTPATLPALRALTISDFETPESVNNTLRFFTAPNLSQLTLAFLHFGPGEGNHQDFSPTFEFLTSREGVLQRVEDLTLAHTECDPDEILERFYRALPNLRKLHIVYERIEDDYAGDVFINTIASQLSDISCPLLEEVKVYGVSLEALVDFARDRKALKRVFHDTEDPEQKKYILPLLLFGVQVMEYQEIEYKMDEDDPDLEADEVEIDYEDGGSGDEYETEWEDINSDEERAQRLGL